MVFCRVFLMATGALLSFGLILIISNTIRLSIYSRQDEIELMLLIGATPRFVKIPFYWKECCRVLSGSLLSLGLMGVTYYVFEKRVSGFYGVHYKRDGFSVYISAVFIQSCGVKCADWIGCQLYFYLSIYAGFK